MPNRAGACVSTSEGLTTTNVGDMGRLARLALNPKNASREEIYLAVISLYRVQGSALGPRERALMNDILRRVEADVRPAVRMSLAERLADDLSAPIDVILMLATDTIEVAGPVIARSPLLKDEHLRRLLDTADAPHQAAIASRFGIEEAVTDRIAGIDSESVLLALLQNNSAQLSEKTFETLFVKSSRNEKLFDVLARRSDLPKSIQNRLNIPEQGKAMEHTAPRAIEPDGIHRLVTKLASSGQLRAGFLLRVLQQGQVDLFDAGLACLLDLPLAQSRERFYGGGPTAVALACRAVGIDRCVFPTVYALSRQSQGMGSGLSPSDRTRVEEVFTFHSKPTALAVLRAA
jgi:uncharacterized protein (DUF2336 family)